VTDYDCYVVVSIIQSRGLVEMEREKFRFEEVTAAYDFYKLLVSGAKFLEGLKK